MAKQSWQQQLINGFSSVAELLTALDLENKIPQPDASCLFPTKVPLAFVQRMQKGNWHDPLLQQVLPSAREFDQVAGFADDPLAENSANAVPGLLHKYHGRVLLIVTGSCAINCRYCFRRHFPYQDNNPGTAGWQQALDYIKQRPSIKEVILSGGDPLLASDRQLGFLLSQIATIDHIKTIRLHSRLPVVLPDRITPALLAIFNSCPLPITMVIHSNHPQELDNQVQSACAKMRSSGIQLLNQSVLLQGINDNVDVLWQLSWRLFELQVIPYYLHQIDRVQGVSHFEVDPKHGRKLMLELGNLLPGHLMPRYVRETPEAPSKIAV